MAAALSLKIYQALRRSARDIDTAAIPLSGRRPEGPMVWLHASSEAQAIGFAELILRLCENREELWFLLTTTSRQVKSRMDSYVVGTPLPQTVILLFAGDDPKIVAHWRPDVCIWTGHPEDHPDMITALAKTARRMILADAEVASGRRPLLNRIPGLKRAMLRMFDPVLCLNRSNQRRIRRLLRQPEPAEFHGQLREGNAPPGCNETERNSVAGLLGTRPVWLAANCLEAEYEAVLKAHKKALRASHRLLLLLVPLEKSNGAELKSRAETLGFSTGLRSDGDEPEAGFQVYIADFPGELGLWYRISPITFVGQTLAAGQAPQPWDPASLGSAILFGKKAGAARKSLSLLERRGAAIEVANSTALSDAIISLLAPDKAATMAHSGWATVTEGSQVLDRLTALTEAALDAGDTLHART